jgi:hypothetical protein
VRCEIVTRSPIPRPSTPSHPRGVTHGEVVGEIRRPATLRTTKNSPVRAPLVQFWRSGRRCKEWSVRPGGTRRVADPEIHWGNPLAGQDWRGDDGDSATRRETSENLHRFASTRTPRTWDNHRTGGNSPHPVAVAVMLYERAGDPADPERSLLMRRRVAGERKECCG